MSTETIEVNVGDAVSRGADAATKADSGKMALNVGPSHPTTHGVLRLMMDLDGDVITRCEPVLGYLHRGDEKIAENMTYNQFVPYTDRLDYLSPLANNVAYAIAVEKLTGLELPGVVKQFAFWFVNLPEFLAIYWAWESLAWTPVLGLLLCILLLSEKNSTLFSKS